jgi:hypothetical protein
MVVMDVQVDVVVCGIRDGGEVGCAGPLGAGTAAAYHVGHAVDGIGSLVVVLMAGDHDLDPVALESGTNASWVGGVRPVEPT